MIVKPGGFDVYGTNTILNRDRFTGFRIIRRRIVVGEGNILDGLSTPRWGDESYSNALVKRNSSATEPTYQTGTPANGSVLPTAWVLIGVGTYETLTPHYWVGGNNWFSDTEFFDVFYKLPDVYRVGWNPSGTRMDAIEQLQDKGIWFWRPDNLPPLTIQCQLNYEFQQKECWDGGNIVNDLTGNSHNGVMKAGVTPSSPGFGQLPYSSIQPWCGTWPADGTYKIEVQGNLGITGDLTIEYIGKFTGPTSNNTGGIVSYSGVNLQNYNGSSTWAMNGVFTATNGTPNINNHVVVTLRGSSNSYSVYALNNQSGGYNYQTITAGTSGIPGYISSFANVGSGVEVGFAGSNTEWDGEMNCFRMWAGPVSDQEAKILANHSQGVVSFGIIV